MTLLERDPNSPPVWRDEIQVTNRYTFGIAGERFFRTIKEKGQILGSRCSNCERTYVPAAEFCERCLDHLDEWIDVGTVGEIITFTHLNVNYDGSPREETETIAFVRLGDGGLIHRLKSSQSPEIQIGMQAKVVFKPAEERDGSITDILYLELIPD